MTDKTKAAAADEQTKTKDLPKEAQDPANFPRMVYRAGHEVRVWNEFDVDTLIVGGPAALADALNNGWFMDPSEAAAAAPEGKDKEGKDVDDTNNPNKVTYDPFRDPKNIRPNEPDNAPLRNTGYVEPQTGDLPDPPNSEAEPPRQVPVPDEEANETAEKYNPSHSEEKDDNEKAAPSGPASSGQHPTGETVEAPPPKPTDNADKDESKSLQDKGAPPGAHKVK
jgi:hypothetical protein